MNERDDAVVGVPGVSGRPDPGADTDRTLRGVQDDLVVVDGLSTDEQVPVFERMHTALADALARTADTAPPPAPGPPGA